MPWPTEAGYGQIVEEWLRSLGLVQYYQAFVDNGYDDLEVCKQIGDPDLDAIGVEVSSHRESLLEAVGTLREQGGTHVYFTLEEAAQTPTPTAGGLSGAQGPSVVAFPRIQLVAIVRDKLVQEGVNLFQPPYVSPEDDQVRYAQGDSGDNKMCFIVPIYIIHVAMRSLPYPRI